MAKIARSYGVDFDKDHPVHGGRHDKFIVGDTPLRFLVTVRSSSSRPEGS
jgi:hypothetical protein